MDGATRQTVKASAFRDWFGNNNDQIETALDFLARKGCLAKPGRRAGDVRSRRTAFSDAVNHVKWPNGKATRSIAFRDPFRAKRETA